MSELLTLTEAKSFLRVEHTDDDTLIQTIVDGSENYIKTHLGISGSFTGSLDEIGQGSAKIATYQITSMWYENRDPNMGGSSMEHSALHIVNPLRALL